MISFLVNSPKIKGCRAAQGCRYVVERRRTCFLGRRLMVRDLISTSNMTQDFSHPDSCVFGSLSASLSDHTTPPALFAGFISRFLSEYPHSSCHPGVVSKVWSLSLNPVDGRCTYHLCYQRPGFRVGCSSAALPVRWHPLSLALLLGSRLACMPRPNRGWNPIGVFKVWWRNLRLNWGGPFARWCSLVLHLRS